MTRRFRGAAKIRCLTPIFLLLAAAPAWAQYKCIDAHGKVSYTEQPCAAGDKRGEIAHGAMSGGPAAAAGGSSDVRVTYYDIYGVSAAALSAAIKSKGPNGYGGLTDSTISYTYKPGPSPAGCRVQTLDTELAITMTLPHWVQPPGAVTPALAAQWQRYLAALRAHENGHVDLVRRTFEATRAALAAVTASSCAALDAEVRGRYDAMVREGRRVNEEYDRQTEHGRTQGATF